MLPRPGRVVAPSLLAGLLVAGSLPPIGWWPLGFAGAALLYWRLGGLALPWRIMAGFAAGLGWFVPGLWWAGAFNWYGAVVLVLAESLFPAAAAALVPARRWRIPAFAGAFTLLEAARSAWPFGGLPVAGAALGQAGGPLLPAARLGGPLLLAALVFLGGAGLATLGALAARVPGADGSRGSLRRAAAGGASVAIVAAVAVAGVLAPDGGRSSGRVEVALVQGGGRRGTSATEVPAADVFEAQVAASRGLDRRNGSRRFLVVWPEDVVKVGARLAGTAPAAYLSSLARRLHATVVAGVTETVSSRRFRNEAVVWGPGGRVVGDYEKVRRVPFGEYVPARAFFSHLADLSAVPLDAIAGHGTGELDTPAAPIGLMVSYEVFFADRGRSAVRAGAELLVVPTNTSSYATTQVPAMEVAADRIQAVSEGRDLVQASPTGYSSVVDAAGAVLERSTLGARQVLRATVSLRRGDTVYERFGDAPVLVASGAALVAALVVAGRRRRRGPRPDTPRNTAGPEGGSRGVEAAAASPGARCPAAVKGPVG